MPISYFLLKKYAFKAILEFAVFFRANKNITKVFRKNRKKDRYLHPEIKKKLINNNDLLEGRFHSTAPQ